MSWVQKAIRTIEDLEISEIRKSSYSPLVIRSRGIGKDMVRLKLWTGEYALESWSFQESITEEDAEFLRVFVDAASKEEKRQFNDFLSILYQIKNEL